LASFLNDRGLLFPGLISNYLWLPVRLSVRSYSISFCSFFNPLGPCHASYLSPPPSKFSELPSHFPPFRHTPPILRENRRAIPLYPSPPKRPCLTCRSFRKQDSDFLTLLILFVWHRLSKIFAWYSLPLHAPPHSPSHSLPHVSGHPSALRCKPILRPLCGPLVTVSFCCLKSTKSPFPVPFFPPRRWASYTGSRGPIAGGSSRLFF